MQCRYTVRLYGILLGRGLRGMVQVYCRQCQQKVSDCGHFVAPIEAQPVRVFDEKAGGVDARPLSELDSDADIR